MSYNSPFSGAEVDDAVTKRHEKNKDTKLDEGGANETTAQETREHIDSTANPHGVTKTQVGLGDVDNVSAADLRDRSTHTGTQPLSTISNAGTIASQDANSVNIDGGTIDGTAIGQSSAQAGSFDILRATKAGFGNTEPSKLLALRFPVPYNTNFNDGFVIGSANNSAVNNNRPYLYDFNVEGDASNGFDFVIRHKQRLGNTWELARATYQTWQFRTNNAERMRINSGGNVLVGTTSDFGTPNNPAKVTGGVFSTVNGFGPTLPNNSFETLFRLSVGSNSQTYLVSADLQGEATTVYQTVYLINYTDSGNVRVTPLVKGSLAEISNSGLDIKYKQQSGGTKSNCRFSAIRLF